MPLKPCSLKSNPKKTSMLMTIMKMNMLTMMITKEATITVTMLITVIMTTTMKMK